MSFKRKNAPEAPSIPPQPPAPELMDVIDEISGVQVITVTGPDGKKKRVTQRVNLTPQEKETLSKAENLISQSLSNIERLYQYDPTAVVNYQPFIQAFSSINNERMQDLSQIGNFKDIAEKVQQFRNINKELAVREFDIKQREVENTLARRGLSNSTEATELRASMARDRSLLEQQLDVNSQNYGEDLANRQLDREARVFNFKETGRQARLQEAEAGYELEKEKQAALENSRINAINENVTRMNVGQGIKNNETEKSNFALANSANALGIKNSQENNANQRYANEVNRITGQYKMELDNFNNTSASPVQRLTDLGFSLAGQYAGSKIGGAISSLNKGPENPGSSPNFGKNVKRREAFKEISRIGR